MLRYQSQVCSQNGEDGIIHEIFRRIGTTTKIFAEVGVGDGCENNTAFLLSQGWTGFWIDGESAFLGALENRDDLQKDCLKYLVAFASKENISALFEQLGVPKEFDLLSLDIDQNTYYAWEGLRSFRPRVVVVEYNAAIPPDVDWKVRYGSNRTWNGTQNFGASLKAFEILGRQFGYSLVGCEFLVSMRSLFVMTCSQASSLSHSLRRIIMNRHVIRCAIVGVIPRVFWIEQVLANTNQAMPLTHAYGVRPRKDHHGVGKVFRLVLHP